MSKKHDTQNTGPAATPDAISPSNISPNNISPNNISPNNISVDDIVTRVNEAQRAFANFTQQQVDAIFHAAAAAATAQRIHLARMATRPAGSSATTRPTATARWPRPSGSSRASSPPPTPPPPPSSRPCWR